MTLLDQGDLYVARFTGDSPASEINGAGELPTEGVRRLGRVDPAVQDGVSHGRRR